MKPLDPDEFFMHRALGEARIALEKGEFPVGCVITEGKDVVASGFRETSRGGAPNELDHAEILALRDLGQNRPGVSPDRLCLYTTLEPCLMCFGAILISGIRRIVYAFEDAMGGATACDLRVLPVLYRSAAPKIVARVLRQESIALMRSFFSDPKNCYLQDTFFAEYTMRQKDGHYG